MFEAVGLGFNPFDKNLKPMMQGFSSKNTVKDIQKKADDIVSDMQTKGEEMIEKIQELIKKQKEDMAQG